MDLYIEYLELNRFTQVSQSERLADLLAARYGALPLDLVLVASQEGLDFWLAHRPTSQTTTPVVFFDIYAQPLDQPLPKPFGAGVTGIAETQGHNSLIDWVPATLPGVNEIIVVRGISPADQIINTPIEELRSQIGDQIHLTDWSGLPLAEILRRATSLPPTSVIFYQVLFEDASGAHHRPYDVHRQLLSAASVPVITQYDHMIGAGAIGGCVYSIEQSARQAAQLGLRILAGEDPHALPVIYTSSHRLIFDHIALQRWNIPIDRLPPGSLIKNRQYTPWEQYHLQFIALGAVLVGLIVLVTYQAIQSRRLHAARQALSQLNAGLENQVRQRTIDLTLANQHLHAEVERRQQVAHTLHLQSQALDQRVRALHCLYSIAGLFETPGLSLAQLLQKSVELLPAAWAQPQPSGACLTLYTSLHPARTDTACPQVYQAGHLDPGQPGATAEVYARGRPVGRLEIRWPAGAPAAPLNGSALAESAQAMAPQAAYASPDPTNPSGVEDSLLVTVAERLGRAIERAWTEESLNESEQVFRLLAENISDAIWIFDFETMRFRYISPAIEPLSGFTPAEILSRDLPSLLPPASLQYFQEVLPARRQAFQQGEVCSYKDEVELPCKSGASLWVEVISRLRWNDTTGRLELYAISRDISERRRNQQLRQQMAEIEQLQLELREQALRDPLTDLFNRRHLGEALQAELARAAADHLPLSIIVMDLDHFKRINDTYGHPVGDEFLRAIAGLITHHTRSSDFACRYSGEEFLLVLPATPSEAAARRAEEIRQRVMQICIPYQNTPLSVTLSLGVASFPAHGRSAEEIVIKADQALYQSKQRGRNRVTVWG